MDKISAINGIQPLQDVIQLTNETDTTERQELLLRKENKEEPGEELSLERIKEAVDKLNEHMLGKNAYFDIRIHEKTNRVLIRLIDSESHHVIKEIPPEEALDRLANIWELAGLLIDKKE